MRVQEKTLYHQIHPLKLAIDWGTGLLSLIPLWYHHLVWALLLAFIPSMIASVLMIRFGDFEKQKKSAFGRYLKNHMTRGAETVRMIGFLGMMAGGWFHLVWAIGGGLLVVLLAWMKGVILPGKKKGK